ncbi:DNA/RNA helicase domain-containing protein, partial [Staphylococcus aureus]|uniref:DNA/RNA helicase domain-containing protein n=1 Tax=Staphylococcus aureus TaxID=1280 RepID=UPI0038B3DCF7
VDEAHLLWTQGKQSYRGQNQLKDLIARAKVVIAVFDRNQILSTEQVIESDQLEQLVSETKANNNHIHLNNQMRINSNEDT